MPAPNTGFAAIKRQSNPFLSLLLLASLVLSAPPAIAIDLKQQRQIYAEAKQQLKSGRYSDYRKSKLKLQGYPLLPYLEYQEIRRVIAKPTRQLRPVNNKRLNEFDQRYPDFPLRRALRQNWLWSLAKKPNKTAFVRYYRDVQDRNLFCAYITAKVASGRPDSAAKSIRRHWNNYGPPAKGCDEEVAQLVKADLLSNSWLVERLLQAMRNGEVKEVKYLRKLLPRGSAARATTFLATDKDPRDRNTERAIVARSGGRSGDDSLYTRLTIIHGIKKYARRDAIDANALWQTLSRSYNFRQQDLDAVQDYLAERAMRQQKTAALGWLADIPAARLNKNIREGRLQLALKARDWAGLQRFANRLPKDVQQEPLWLYWRGRAAEALSQTSKKQRKANAKLAKQLFNQLARLEHDEYYAFLAADRLNKPYRLTTKPTPVNKGIQQALLKRNDIRRTQELLAINKKIDARREWWSLQKRLSKPERQQTAILAQQWGWHRQAIGVLSNLAERGDLALRYPLPWQPLIERQSQKNEIDPAWAYGILRAESMYQSDAKSGAGAYGLMQLMPPTAKQTAKRAGVRLRGSRQLFQPATNIPLGTYYLGEMMDRFDGHAAVSTAAYNAGPNRVKHWLPDRGTLPVDIWVETIPFTETRRYVKKVMQYAAVFEWRMSGKPQRLASLMPAVTPTGGNLIN